MRAGKRRERQVARIRMTLVNTDSRAFFDDASGLGDVREVQSWIDALLHQVQRKGDDVGIAGTLAVPEERTLDAVCTSQQSQLGRGDACTAIVVGMQT